MGWLDDLQSQLVGLDTTPLIYFIEKYPVYVDFIRPFFNLVARGEIRIVTSTTTLLEVLVHPIRHGDAGLMQKYREILLNSEISLVDLSCEIAEEAARLRAIYGVRTPDAIQLATAIYSQADFFLTNDKQLSAITEI